MQFILQPNTLDLELDYLVGGYMVLGLPNESPVYPYAIVGVTKGELTASASGFGNSFSDSASESDISYGVGANLNINKDFQVNGEYMQIARADIVPLDARVQPVTASIELREAAKPTLDHCLHGGAGDAHA